MLRHKQGEYFCKYVPRVASVFKNSSKGVQRSVFSCWYSLLSIDSSERKQHSYIPSIFTDFVWTPNKNFAYVTEEKRYMNYIKVFLPFLKTTERNKRHTAKMTQETFFACLSGRFKKNQHQEAGCLHTQGSGGQIKNSK